MRGVSVLTLRTGHSTNGLLEALLLQYRALFSAEEADRAAVAVVRRRAMPNRLLWLGSRPAWLAVLDFKGGVEVIVRLR
jgi:hypothetical protein